MSLTQQPLVSILLLSMNHAPYIEQCVQSIAAQSYKNIEIVYLDNVSSDNTYDECERFLKSCGLPYRLFKNETSKSICSNFNFLLDQSTGKYICPFSADDWMDPKNIQKKVEFYIDHPETGALFSNGWFYFEDTKQLELNNGSSFLRGKIYKEVLTKPDCVFYVGMMYDKKIFEKVGKWDENLLIEDTDMFIRIALLAPIDFLAEPLVYYRRSSGSVSKNKPYMMRGFVQYYQKYKNVRWINMRAWLAEKNRSFAADSIDHGKNKEGFHFLLQAMKINPLSAKNLRTLFYLIRSSLKPAR